MLELSVDNRTTGPIYRFDQSLMERLFKSGFPMSQLDVQRRMRPTVSSLIRFEALSIDLTWIALTH